MNKNYLYKISIVGNKGVGKKLHKFFIDWCNEKNTNRKRVVVSSGNIRAINFYKKNKFKEYDLVLESEK